MIEVWTKGDWKTAALEGWNIWNEDGQDPQIQRYGDAEMASDDTGLSIPQLGSDADAWKTVVEKARQGSAVHRKALRLVSAQERARIAEQCGELPV